MRRMIIIIGALMLVVAVEILIVTLTEPTTLLEEVTPSNISNTQSTKIIDQSNIIIDSPKPMDEISSPVSISGKVRGSWVFEASFPIMIVDWDGLIIGSGYGRTRGNWMTSDFIPFDAVVTFTRPANISKGTFNQKGTIIFKKDNPSGLPEGDASVEIPILFQ